MKKHAEHTRRRSASPEERLEEVAGAFLARHPRFFLHAGIGLGSLLIGALFLSEVCGR